MGLRRFFRRDQWDAERSRELESYIQIETDDNIARGMSPEAAREAALRKLGNRTRIREDVYGFNTVGLLDTVGRDVRYGLRMLRRNPTFALVSLLTLALGIGANTAVFTVVNSVLIKPLPYPQADELIAVWNKAPGAPGISDVSGDLRLSPSMFFTYSEHNRVFQHIGIWFAASSAVTGLGDPEQVRMIGVSAGTLEALDVKPVLGRWLSKDDQVPNGTAVMLGYGYWQRRFGGDRSIIGRRITIDSRLREIVGVMPQGFRIATADPEVIGPFGFDRSRLILPPFGFQSVARLKPGVTIEQASADMARMLPIWMMSWPAFPGVNPNVYQNWRITPALRPLKQDVVGNIANVLWVVMGTIGIVMVIACANVANLLLVRADARQQELAVRAALGAGSWRIVRELLLESLLLGVLGGMLGLALAYVGLRALVAIGPATLPRLQEISIDGRALAFCVGVSLVSGVVFGLIPALKYTGPRISSVLRGGGRSASHSRERHRARNVLVVAQVALALVLLVGSGLMIRTFLALRDVQPGFTQPEQLQTVRVNIPPSLVPEPQRVTRMQNDILDKLSAIPGVSSAAFESVMPMEGRTPNWDAVRIEGKEYREGEIPAFRFFKNVGPGVFQTMGTRIVAGRDYTWTDLYEQRPVIMISENLAREAWGSASAALGKRIRQGPNAVWREVIGVVEDVHDNGVHVAAPSTVYWPVLGGGAALPGQMPVTRLVSFIVRSPQAGTEALLSQIRQAVWSVNGSLPVDAPRTMQEYYDTSLAGTSFAVTMLAISGTMALLLGIIGLYGVIAYAVSQRRREIGIRLALGAQHGALRRRFVRHGIVLTCVGIVLGIGAAVAVTRLMASLLFDVSPLDPLTYVAVAALLMISAALASYVPARRASAVPPIEALTAE
jgi:predicted permease